MKDLPFKIGAVAVAVVATTGLVAAASSANFGGGFFGHNEDIKKSIDSGDYNAFKASVGDGKGSNVTEEQFSKMAEAHDLMDEGKFEEAKQLVKESGIMHFGMKGHGKMMKGHFDPEKRVAIEAAFEANDYNAWVAAVGVESRQAKEVTQDEFPKLIEAHDLMEKAKELRNEIGLGFGKNK